MFECTALNEISVESKVVLDSAQQKVLVDNEEFSLKKSTVSCIIPFIKKLIKQGSADAIKSLENSLAEKQVGVS